MTSTTIGSMHGRSAPAVVAQPEAEEVPVTSNAPQVPAGSVTADPTVPSDQRKLIGTLVSVTCILAEA